MISNDKLTRALTYLAETDEPAAKARGLLAGLEAQEKTILAVETLKHEGTIQHKEAKARTSEAYAVWRDKYESAVVDNELYRNKRKTAELIIEVWRSFNANQRRGNIS